jgi:hypothetical protein
MDLGILGGTKSFVYVLFTWEDKERKRVKETAAI